MADFSIKNESKNETFADCCHVMLTKDRRTISRARCINPPSKMPALWSISDMVRCEKIHLPPGLPCCTLMPAYENGHQEKEWKDFLHFLWKHKRVATGKIELNDFYILPPKERMNFNHVTVLYKEGKRCNINDSGENGGQAGGLTRQKASLANAETCGVFQPIVQLPESKPELMKCEEVVCSSGVIGERISRDCKFSDVGDKANNLKAVSSCNTGNGDGSCGSQWRNLVQVDPSYLKTLGHAHSSWIFGAIAELIDNSRDAQATKLKISINMVYSKKDDKDIPMLSIVDDGHGMTHADILRMVSFGHKHPETDDSNRIGRFGIGFKTGAMRLGKDALVLTQSESTRSIAFLSQSLNEGKDNLVIPIVSYRKIGQHMEIDANVQDEDLAKYNLKAIKEFSPFNKYLIGEKAGLFIEKGTGTQIYIWNLDKWGSNYCLQWESGMSGGSSFHQGDITIRSKRVRSRPGQMSQLVPLDYSLRAYLEVIFFEPRMKIYVQGAPVKARPLSKSLHKTIIKNGCIMGKPVQLILGRCQLEWEQANCGMFLYWHGRLIEAYKRVGSMIHNGDSGRGVIGVIDVTGLMKDDDGLILVHNNKQGFQDSEVYAELEKWLGVSTDEYLDKYINKIQLAKGIAVHKPDHEWVQCDKCRKWRVLEAGFNVGTLPAEWFCYMKPFNGRCDMPEQKMGVGVVTISEKRSRNSKTEDPVESEDGSVRDTKKGRQRKEEDEPFFFRRCTRASRSRK